MLLSKLVYLSIVISAKGSKITEDQLSLPFDTFQSNSIVNEVFQINSNYYQNEDGDECPPCFNCNLPNFECTQFSKCNVFTGMCECRPGYGGMDCSDPVCGSLADGRNRKVRDGDKCDCEDGWGGINCNICTRDSVCDFFMPNGLQGTCYQQGITINSIYQMCDVTNEKIVSILKGKKPQATFSCNKTAEACDFQFWIAEKESFYCDLSECQFNYDLGSNSTKINCENIQCKCLPDRMLCGESGSIDISDFLTETIKGPGDFSCDVAKHTCRFSEPSMNDLIMSVFGDPYITLHCQSGECVHYSEIPGYESPSKPQLRLGNLILIIGVIFVCCFAIAGSIGTIRRGPLFENSISLGDDDDDDSDSLLRNFIPTTFSFENISYSINGKPILNDIFGVVKPRECLAIMGGSGAGKTTLLDILACKNKTGEVSGSLYINGNKIDSKNFKKAIGFVDQEDNLIPTLTVYETVLNSALLRLPKTMSVHAKKLRVLEVLKELRILPIKERIIGSDFQRGISGGEKRRVAIACELVTSPSILFLDEPTSGLDSYNARNVIECLVRLSRDFERTIIFTIHQPRSNIVSLFDKLLLLSEGELIYSGDMIKCNDFFGKYGYKCPLGYNIADYLIDITAENSKFTNSVEGLTPNSSDQTDPVYDNVHETFVRAITNTSEIDTTTEWEHFAVHRDEYNNTPSTSYPSGKLVLLDNKLYQIFKESTLAIELKQEIDDMIKNRTLYVFKNGAQANFFDQLLILCSRSFKNAYRNPKLLLSHYIISLIMGVFCGYLYYDITNDISGFQNRLGLFFFILALFGFSALTGLHSFSIERIIFIRERANNYYHPASYYLSKIIGDVLPLRIFPPIILISIMYPLVGLNMENNGFLKATLILILFNLAISAEILVVGILLKEPGTSTMLGVLALLFSLLFAGLFINRETVATSITWLQWVSLFHYAYEALSVNEVKDLTLKETKYGLSIEVPGAVILSTFGFNVGALWNDVICLSVGIVVFLFLGYVFLHYLVVERR